MLKPKDQTANTWLFYFLFCLPFAGFSQEKKMEQHFRQQQDHIFSTLSADRQKAKQSLDSLFTLEGKMSDTTAGLNYNLLGIYYNYTGQYDSALISFKKGLRLNGNHQYRTPRYLRNIGNIYRKKNLYDSSNFFLKKVQSFYLEQQDSLGYALILSDLSANYNLMLHHEKAVKAQVEAIRLMEKHNASKANLGAAVQRLANTYLKQKKFDYALEQYDLALEYFQQSRQMSNYYLTFINIAQCHIYLNDYKRAIDIINEGLSGLKKHGNPPLLAIALSVKAEILKIQEEYTAARKTYEKSMNYAFDSNVSRLVQIAREYLELLMIQKDYTKADKLIEKTEPYLSATNIEYHYSYLEVLADYYAQRASHDRAYAYSKKAHRLKDSSYYSNNEQLVNDIQTAYRLQEKEAENKTLNSTIAKKEASISNLTLIVLFLGVLLILIIVIWRTRNHYHHKLIKLEKNRSKELAQKLAIEEENTRLKERLIQQQKTELLGYSLEVAQVNERINTLVGNISENDNSENVKSDLKNLITVNKNWESFLSRFKELNPHFIPRLSKHYPKLTQKDLEFCSLVRINISYKDIANFLQISHESVHKKRYRIAQKMDLEKGVDFQQFIIQF